MPQAKDCCDAHPNADGQGSYSPRALDGHKGTDVARPYGGAQGAAFAGAAGNTEPYVEPAAQSTELPMAPRGVPRGVPMGVKSRVGNDEKEEIVLETSAVWQAEAGAWPGSVKAVANGCGGTSGYGLEEPGTQGL